MKTTLQWYDEASSFVYEWLRACDKLPTFDDVLSESINKEYAETLYNYVEKVIEKEYATN